MDYSSNSDMIMGGIAAAIGLYLVIMIVALILSVVMIIAMWKLFVKAGRPGWAAIVPFYNSWVLCDIVANNNIMWFIFMFIPFLNIVSVFVLYYGLAKSFGKDIGFAILNIFFWIITLPILAFGNSRYVGKSI